MEERGGKTRGRKGGWVGGWVGGAGAHGRLYLCLSFTSTLCIQTPCALTRPCGLDSISRNELRGVYSAPGPSLPRWRSSWSKERR